MKKRILVVCKDNLFLSKIGEGFLKKFGGYWKEIVSGGIQTSHKTIPDSTAQLLKELGLNEAVDITCRNIDSYPPSSVDYIIVLSDADNIYKTCVEKFPDKEIVQFSIATGTSAQVVADIEKECLAFVKAGPIKRWLTE